MAARRTILALLTGGAILASGALPALAAPSGGKTGGGTGTCKRSCSTADTTAPFIALDTPVNGSTVTGIVEALGRASDNSGSVLVDVQVDGGVWQRATGSTSWSWLWRTAEAVDGTHTLSARAQDASGNTSVSTTVVTVSNAPAADTTPPAIAITAPDADANVSGSVTVQGTATDSRTVTAVDVSVDGGSWHRALGTTEWSWTWDTAAVDGGVHELTARATDGSGNTSTTTTRVTVASASTASGPDLVLSDPAARYGLRLVGRGRTAEWGSMTGLLYWEEMTNRRAMFFRDGVTGATSYVTLPADTRTGWSSISYTMTSASDLWVFGGAGPLVLRHYALTGSPVPTSATLVSAEVLGDSDSRPGDLIRLESGAVVASWAQQGAVGPQGLWLRIRSAEVSHTVGPLQFMPSKSTNQALAQHPADGSVWLFNDPDAWGSIGAARLVESDAGLSVSWADAYWIDGRKYGMNRPDPENPDITVTTDDSTGEIVLAYQSATRRLFQSSPTVVIGSQPVVARVPAAGMPSFTLLPVYVERVSDLGLTVANGSTRLAYHPIDEATMTFDRLHVSTFSDDGWTTAQDLGRFRTAGEWITAGSSRHEVAAGMSDGSIHLFQLNP